MDPSIEIKPPVLVQTFVLLSTKFNTVHNMFGWEYILVYPFEFSQTAIQTLMKLINEILLSCYRKTGP